MRLDFHDDVRRGTPILYARVGRSRRRPFPLRARQRKARYPTRRALPRFVTAGFPTPLRGVSSLVLAPHLRPRLRISIARDAAFEAEMRALRILHDRLNLE